MSSSFTDPRYEPPAPPLAYGVPPRPKSGFKVLLLVLGIGGLCLLLCCGGGVGLGYFFVNLMATEIEQQVRDHPQIREHLGEIEELKMDITKSMAHENDEVYVYNVKGTRGAGELSVEQYTDGEGDEVITAAELRLPDGQTIPLDMMLFE